MIDLSRYYFAPLGDLLCTSKRKAADGPLEIEELDNRLAHGIMAAMLPIFTILPRAAMSKGANSLHMSMTLNRFVMKIDCISSRFRSVAGTK